MIGVHVSLLFKVVLELEAWQEHMTLAAYVRRLLERSRKPDGRPRRVIGMPKRGRPRCTSQVHSKSRRGQGFTFAYVVSGEGEPRTRGQIFKRH